MKKIFLLLVIILGFFMRAYDFKERFNFAHDNDLASWIVKDIVVDHHVRLIGQLTSSPGIFIGPLFYYSLIPFYWITRMDPIGSVAFSWIVGVLSVGSIYYVFRKFYGDFSGNIAALIYAGSASLAFTDRQVVPTTLVMLWSIWFFYAIHLWFTGHKKSLWLLGLLFALVWHLHLALGLLFPLILVGAWMNRKKVSIKDFVVPTIIFVVLSAPLIIFEARHNYQQTQALVNTFKLLGHHSGNAPTFPEKLHKTIKYAARNANGIFMVPEPTEPWLYIVPIILIGSLFVIKGSRKNSVVYSLWIVLYVLFFSLHPIDLSEYYLAGLNILFIAGFVLLSETIWKRNKMGKILVVLVLSLFVIHNIQAMLNTGSPNNGYIEKKALVAEIKADAAKHGYPCVSVSYITKLGYNFGYRYFFYLAGLHVNMPDGRAPVYSIVFPKSIVDKVDNSFGAIGLIYPDYSRYNTKTIAEACAGPDPNLTGSMFGFTK